MLKYNTDNNILIYIISEVNNIFDEYFHAKELYFSKISCQTSITSKFIEPAFLHFA